MKIAEVSEKYHVTPDTLRYYERIGLLKPVARNESGIRDYSEDDIHRLEFIKCMRRAGLPIDVLIEYIHLLDQGDETIEARIDLLKEQRVLLQARILEMQETLKVLDYKISLYGEAVHAREKELA
ncbi:MerR family transcriptional regulator [Leptolinea sp. HRD-7]|jgi:DNA-binding transcriptional MerR regulator|nr:MerR family transcriptional regulator [Leptolinea sp. HRD-7]